MQTVDLVHSGYKYSKHLLWVMCRPRISQWHPFWIILSECILGNFTIFSSVIQVKILQFVLVWITDWTLREDRAAEDFIVLSSFFCSERNHIFSCGLALHYLGFFLCMTDLAKSGLWYIYLWSSLPSPHQMNHICPQGPSLLVWKHFCLLLIICFISFQWVGETTISFRGRNKKETGAERDFVFFQLFEGDTGDWLWKYW